MEFVSHWRLWYKRWSVWLAGLYAAVTAAIVANPYILLGSLAYFPNNFRVFLASAVFVLVFAVPVIVQQLRQPKLVAQKEELNAPK